MRSSEIKFQRYAGQNCRISYRIGYTYHSYIISQLPHTIRMIMAKYCTDRSNFGGAGAQNVFNSRCRKKCSKLTTFYGLHTTNTGCGNQDLHYKVS